MWSHLPAALLSPHRSQYLSILADDDLTIRVSDEPETDPVIADAVRKVNRLRRHKRARREDMQALLSVLDDLTDVLLDAGRLDEEVAVLVEIVKIRSARVREYPDEYFYDDSLSVAVAFLEDGLERTGRWQRGLAAIEEAVAACRCGVERGWGSYNLWLAAVLTRLSTVLSHVGRREEALAAAKEARAVAEQAVSLAREARTVAKDTEFDFVDGFSAGLVEAVTALAERHTELDCPEKALAVLAETGTDLRPAPDGSSERGCLAVLLTVYSRHLESAGRIGNAADTLGAAIDIFRERILWEDGRVVGDVVSDRRNHSEFLATLERQHEERLVAHLRHHAALLGTLGRQHEAHLASHEADRYDRTPEAAG